MGRDPQNGHDAQLSRSGIFGRDQRSVTTPHEQYDFPMGSSVQRRRRHLFRVRYPATMQQEPFLFFVIEAILT